MIFIIIIPDTVAVRARQTTVHDTRYTMMLYPMPDIWYTIPDTAVPDTRYHIHDAIHDISNKSTIHDTRYTIQNTRHTIT